ncbi:MAG: FAD-binding protein, partial [Bacteroidota bacterium]|nr:FAD-binding protein [Bacteroidota bacterium]
MQQKISLKILPHEASDNAAIQLCIAKASGKKKHEITGFQILKKSIDARSKTAWINMTVNAYINEPFIKREADEFLLKNVTHSQKKVVIIGAGPA